MQKNTQLLGESRTVKTRSGIDLINISAGIGFAPNGMRTMDLIEPGFRPLYEQICVGNKGEKNQDIFFEGMLLEEGLGM